MKVLLSLIHPSPARVRKSLDTEKLDELSGSMKEIGQLCPVLLRPNSDRYEIVYGHRRVDAARQAGYQDIEAEVKEMTDIEALVASLSENIVREDMPAIEIAKALKAIKDETGWTNEVIGSKFGWSNSSVDRYLDLLNYEIPNVGEITAAKLEQAKAGTGGDKMLVEAVLQKAASEGLSTRQTREVAEKMKEQAEDTGNKGIAWVMNTPYKEMGFAEKHQQEKRENTTAKGHRTTAEEKPRVFTQEEIDQSFRWMDQPIYEEIEELSKALSAKIQFMLQQIFETKIKTQEGAALLATIATQLERLAQTTLRTTSEINDVGPIMEQAIKIKDVSERWHFLDGEIDKLYNRGVK